MDQTSSHHTDPDIFYCYKVKKKTILLQTTASRFLKYFLILTINIIFCQRFLKCRQWIFHGEIRTGSNVWVYWYCMLRWIYWYCPINSSITGICFKKQIVVENSSEIIPLSCHLRKNKEELRRQERISLKQLEGYHHLEGLIVADVSTSVWP